MTAAERASDVRVCLRDAEPLVFTMEFPGAEYLCVVCNGHEDIFGDRARWTPEVQRRLDELTEQYERERAERRETEYRPRRKVGGAGVTAPTCNGCGATPAEGTALDASGKPSAWFTRTRIGVTEFACSRACIPEREAVLPW